MSSNHHDTGYKELFSHPEFVQQLIEGFAPNDIAGLMNFATLKQHSGNYITPLFEEKFEDVVWSVEVTWNGITQDVFLYILLEFQSAVDRAIPIRLMHYVACFYSELLKQRVITPGQGLPPVFPVVLYNGSQKWTAKADMYDMIAPEPPEFLRVYQPHLRYYLVDESRYTAEELNSKATALSGVFGVENAGDSWESLQAAVDRVVADVSLDRLSSLVEDRDMLAENLENLVKKERLEGLQEGRREAELRALAEKRETVRNLLSFGVLSDEQIAEATGMALDEVARLRLEDKH